MINAYKDTDTEGPSTIKLFFTSFYGALAAGLVFGLINLLILLPWQQKVLDERAIARKALATPAAIAVTKKDCRETREVFDMMTDAQQHRLREVMRVCKEQRW